MYRLFTVADIKKAIEKAKYINTDYCDKCYVAVNYVAVSLLRREVDDDYLKAIVLKATLKEEMDK